MIVKREVGEFLLENGFTLRNSDPRIEKYTYGPNWTNERISGDVYPINIIKKSGKWYCYIFGLLLPTLPEPDQLMVVIGQMESYGIK